MNLRAWELARESLVSNIKQVQGRPILTAGARQFRSLWTRDFCFSAGGLVAAGHADAARSTLRTIVSFQREDGLLPRLIDSRSFVLRVILGVFNVELPIDGTLKPNYVGEHGSWAVDGNALACIAAERCADAAFARELLPPLARALAWYDGHLKEGLVDQPPFSDWQDSIKARRGRVFFTNLIYWRAHEALAALSVLAGKDPAPWKAKADAVKERVKSFFEDAATGAFFNIERGGPLSSDGLLFAVVWGFVEGDAARRVLAALDAAKAWTPFGPRCATPDYPDAGRGWITKFAGIPDYHDRVVWLWQTALAARAFRAAGETARAEELSRVLARIVERDGAVGEVYEPDTGELVKRRFYRSETPFSWGSAMALEALA